MIRKTRLILPVAALLLASCGGGGDGTVSHESNAGAADGSNITAGNNNAATAQAPAIAPALPATEVANAVPDLPLTKIDAYRLLEQTTFGVRLSDVEVVEGSSTEAWINEQLTLPATYMSDGLNAAANDGWNEYINVWWRMALLADDQLRQRVAFALSQIFVISANDGLGTEQPALANYYDILLRHSFGNYRELIEEITLSPVMGEYLSMKGNQKPNVEENLRPDENYARELLQLFSIGLSLLNDDGTPMLDDDGVPLPTYDQDDVEAFAHVFTGWHFANADDFRWPTTKDFITPMKSWDEYHDKGEKHLLNGTVLPSGQSAEADLKGALDNIANHPNVGPFIVKQLIQKLITSNPSSEYVYDVVQVFNSNANGERGNLGSTIKAILTHKEAREGHITHPETFGKLKEPLLRVSQLWRAFEPKSIHPDFSYTWTARELSQAPLASPSVFNFFTPSFSQPGAIRDAGLVSPEFEILDESSVITMTSRILANSMWTHNFKVAEDSEYITINIDREMNLESDHDALLDHLDFLLLGGRMSDELRLETKRLMDDRDYKNAASQRVAEAIFLISSSPEAAIQF